MPREQTAEQFFAAHFRGPDRVDLAPTRTDPYAGRTVLSSGSTTVTVSTALVNSDSIISYGTHIDASAVSVASGGFVAVSSIVSGVSFDLIWARGGAVAKDVTVMWRLTHT